LVVIKEREIGGITKEHNDNRERRKREMENRDHLGFEEA